MIKKLNSFYLLDDMLIYASADFIGLNPNISKALSFESAVKTGGTKVRIDEFEMNENSFQVTLTSFFTQGPMRSYKRAEILRDEMEIIRYETGGGAPGYKYTEGNKYFVGNGNAYLFNQGLSLKDAKSGKIHSGLIDYEYYLFCFKDVIIPTKHRLAVNKNPLPFKEHYTRGEIEPLRQTEWEAKFQYNNHDLHIIKTSIPGFSDIATSTRRYDQYVPDENRTALTKIKILVDGTDYKMSKE